jgi:hypothetical protein
MRCAAPGLGRNAPIPYIYNLNDDPIIELSLPERKPVGRCVNTVGRIVQADE